MNSSKENTSNNKIIKLVAIGLFTLALTLILVLVTIDAKKHSRSLEQTHSRHPSNKSNPSPPTQRILCWVLSVDSARNNAKSEAVAKTWGRRCDKLLIVKNGSQVYEDGHLLTIPIVHESRRMLWHKVVQVCEWLYDRHLNSYDWFFKADDDTYLLVDELRKFLAQKGEDPLEYYGHRFRPFVRQGYMSGGSGYVMSAGALGRLVERGLRAGRPECHLARGSVEDVEMGSCLESVGVRAGDTRDSRGRETFLPLSPVSFLGAAHLTTDRTKEALPTWYDQYVYYNRTRGCCTNRPISMHYIEPDLMYLIDWLLYDVQRGGC